MLDAFVNVRKHTIKVHPTKPKWPVNVRPENENFRNNVSEMFSPKTQIENNPILPSKVLTLCSNSLLLRSGIAP